ncbi:hypothetical protein B27N_03608 [Alcanivorax marinus]|nr:hypothetical protein [Alloalcanivorax marinus]
MMIIALFLLAICFKGIRDLLLQEIRNISPSATSAAKSLFKTLEPFFLDYQRSQLTATEIRDQLLRNIEV